MAHSLCICSPAEGHLGGFQIQLCLCEWERKGAKLPLWGYHTFTEAHGATLIVMCKRLWTSALRVPLGPETQPVQEETHHLFLPHPTWSLISCPHLSMTLTQLQKIEIWASSQTPPFLSSPPVPIHQQVLSLLSPKRILNPWVLSIPKVIPQDWRPERSFRDPPGTGRIALGIPGPSRHPWSTQMCVAPSGPRIYFVTCTHVWFSVRVIHAAGGRLARSGDLCDGHN